MTHIITSTITREKLRLKEFESDSIIVTVRESTNQSEKEFYSAAVKLLALIYTNANELTGEDL